MLIWGVIVVEQTPFTYFNDVIRKISTHPAARLHRHVLARELTMSPIYVDTLPTK